MIAIQQNGLEHVVCKLTATLYRSECIDRIGYSRRVKAVYCSIILCTYLICWEIYCHVSYCAVVTPLSHYVWYIRGNLCQLILKYCVDVMAWGHFSNYWPFVVGIAGFDSYSRCPAMSIFGLPIAVRGTKCWTKFVAHIFFLWQQCDII